MQEIINCPSCQRRLQVPDTLIGQDVQCPTCGATFVAALGGRGPMPVEKLPDESLAPLEMVDEEPHDRPARRRRHEEDDFGDYDDEERYRRRRRRDLAPHRGSTILTLGILSLVLPCVGLILGPIAWAMGTADVTEFRAGRMDPDGEGITNGGRICGIIGTFLNLAFVLLCCSFIFVGRRW